MNLDRSDYPSLRSGFLQRAKASPGRPALSVRGATLTYGEIDLRARVLAAALTEAVGGRPERIGVFAYRSETAYVGVLAALFAGAAFVPLNRQFPPHRTRRMIERASLDAIIVDAESAAQLGEILEGGAQVPPILAPEPGAAVRVAGLVVHDARSIGRREPLVALPPVVPEDLAYLLFTSGSTGEPKGVAISHGNVRHFLGVMADRYALTPDDRVSQTFDQTFDLSVFDVFMTWDAGACLCVPQQKDLLAPARFVNREGLTIWFSVPSLVAYMRRMNHLAPASLPTLRWSLFCGEALPRRAAEEWQAAAPGSVLENLYGPTELTIACFAYRWTDASGDECVNDVVPIGQPLPGLAAVVVDEALEIVEPGRPGELCVSGRQTSPGYWRDVARTAERFVEIAEAGGARFYRTGDMVSRLPSGNYAYLGRNDSQIKVRGYRVELAEVEAALLRHPSVHAAAVVPWPLGDGGRQVEGLVAFVNGTAVQADELRKHVSGILPAYMTPREIVVLAEFPLNANGKVDRRELVATLEARTAAGSS